MLIVPSGNWAENNVIPIRKLNYLLCAWPSVMYCVGDKKGDVTGIHCLRLERKDRD